jgi:hypothetical protein
MSKRRGLRGKSGGPGKEKGSIHARNVRNLSIDPVTSYGINARTQANDLFPATILAVIKVLYKCVGLFLS